jgi:RNA polymerase sigma factor (sigma-70 family)
VGAENKVAEPGPALEEDRDLLERFRRGERGALSIVFHRYAPGVAALLRHGFVFQSRGRWCRFRGARSPADLEDRLHDVFARAFSEPARLGYDGISPYDRYVASIARNLAIDDFRRKEHTLLAYALEDEIPAAEAPAGVLNAPTDDAEANVASDELSSLVIGFKAGLTGRERQVFELRFEEGLEHKDIMARTRLSASKIKTSELRIRRAFFRLMKKHGYFDAYTQDRGGWLRSIVGVIA